MPSQILHDLRPVLPVEQQPQGAPRIVEAPTRTVSLPIRMYCTEVHLVCGARGTLRRQRPHDRDSMPSQRDHSSMGLQARAARRGRTVLPRLKHLATTCARAPVGCRQSSRNLRLQAVPSRFRKLQSVQSTHSKPSARSIHLSLPRVRRTIRHVWRSMSTHRQWEMWDRLEGDGGRTLDFVWLCHRELLSTQC